MGLSSFRTQAYTFALILSAFQLQSAHAAAPVVDPAELMVGRVETREVALSDESNDLIASLEAPQTPIASSKSSTTLTIGLTEAGVIVDQIINLGQKVWAIIEKGRPVANFRTDTANALPMGVKSVLALEGWSTPKVRRYQQTVYNLYGRAVIDFSYLVIFTYGGSYEGKGQYLSQVSILPENLYVSWGWQLNANVSVPNITNAGTKDSPMAAAQVLLDWTVETPFLKDRSTATYYVRGDGKFVEL